MNLFALSTFRRKAIALLILVGSLAGTAKLNAQVALTFSGGGGSPISITFATPINYTIGITPTIAGSNFPYFVFQGVGNLFNNVQFQVTPSAPKFSRVSPNSAGPFSTEFISAGSASNSLTSTDLYTGPYGGFTGLGANMAIGDVFTLSAGTFTTVNNYSGLTTGQVSALTGTYNTILIDLSGHNLGAGVSAIPEPSTYAAIAGAAMLGLAVWKRRRQQPVTAVPATVATA